MNGLIHGNTGKRRFKKITPKIQEYILNNQMGPFLEELENLNQPKYKHLGIHRANTSLLSYQIKKIFNVSISQQAIGDFRRKEKIFLKNSQKNTKKEIRKQRKNDEKEKKETIIVNDCELAPETKKSNSYSHHTYLPGEVVELDAGEYQFTPKCYCHAHLAADRAENQVVGMRFELRETTEGYMHTMKQVNTNRGIPKKIQTDKRSSFIVNKKPSSPEKDFHTSFEYACYQLGCNLSCSSTPESKPLVERYMFIVQDVIASLATLWGLESLEDLNDHVEEFIDYINNEVLTRRYFSISLYDKPKKDSEMDMICSLLSFGVLDKGSALSFKNERYHLIDQNENFMVRTKETRTKKLKFVISETLDGRLLASREGKVYKMISLSEARKLNLEKGDKIDLESLDKMVGGYTPKYFHPWGFEYQQFMRRKSLASRTN